MNKTAMLCVVAAALTTGVAPALADQCAWNNNAIAQKALDIVKRHPTVLEYCEPCGERLDMSQAFTPKSIQIDAGHGELVIDGKGVDLAYLYVKTSTNVFENVGLLAQCGADDVSAKIVDGKPSGRTKARHGHATKLPPPPPPPPRATSIDELAGDWTVRIETKQSTCTGVARGASSTTRWRVTVTNGRIAVKSDDGIDLVGSPDTQQRMPVVRAVLHSTKQPSGTSISLSLAWKASFHGDIVRAEPKKAPGDPVCVVHQSVQGRRIATASSP